MSNVIRDRQGFEVAWRCRMCQEFFSSMWGNTCNKCRAEAERHDALLNEVKSLRKQLATSQLNQQKEPNE